LALLNGEFSLAIARSWSGRLLAEHGRDTESLVRAALAEAFSRPASGGALRAAEAFLVRQSAEIAAGGEATATDSLPQALPPGYDPSAGAAVVDFCHAVLNANEFVYLD
jgi:hypothetical protein